MSMKSDIQEYLNSINDKRIVNALTQVMSIITPTGFDTAITAYAGGGQANATPLKKKCSFHDVTVVATAADSILLPLAMVGESHFVKNSAALAMQVFATSPSTIDSVATGTGVEHLAGDGVWYICVVQGNYIRLGGVSTTEVFGAITATNITSSAPNAYDHNTTITALAGGANPGTALTGEFNNVTTCATAGDSVNLPTAVQGRKITVKNSGAASLAVFPFSGDSINALAVDLSVNIPVGGQLTFRAISATVWETNEALVLPAPTTQRGELVFKAADNAADHEVVVTNASFGQGSTLTIPDPGATGTFMVRDSNGDFAMGDGDFFKLSADTLAAAGTGQGDAAALVDQLTIVTGADGAAGVSLPAAADLLEYTVINDHPIYAVKVWTVNAGDDVINELAADEAFILGPKQQATFKAISATQWYAKKSAAEPTTETHFEVFDDFLAAALDTTNNWITFDGTTGAAQAAATVTAPEGQVTMINGAANDAQDKTVMSLILVAKGSLISLGKTVFETRVSFSAITGCSWGFGLGDVLANDTEVANYTVNSGVVADDAGIANAISFVFDTDATTAQWQACSTNGGTVGNAAAEEPLTDVPAVNTYQVLRIEVDASGDARFYIDGVLRATRATAVATTALLIPYIWGDSAVDAQTACTVAIDYIKFQGHRPASNA